MSHVLYKGAPVVHRTWYNGWRSRRREERAMYGRDSRGGLDPRYAAPLCYALGPITGIYFIVNEKFDRSVKFHAWQSSLLFFGVWAFLILASMIADLLGRIPAVGFLFHVVVDLLWFVLPMGWLVVSAALMYKAYHG